MNYGSHPGRLVCGLLFLLIGSSTSAPCEIHAADRPNVLFIAADDLRNDLGCYGHPLAVTPNLDRLAARGTLFQYAYCQQALCNPSRTSMLTGLRPDSLKIWDLPTHFRQVEPDLVTLPEHFKNQGYHTQCIGKIFHNWRQEIQGDPQSWSVPQVMHYATHGSDVAEVPGAVPPNRASARRCERRDVPDEAYFDGRIAARAVTALGELSSQDQPFFLAVGFWKPHLPFNPPAKYWDLYERRQIDLPANPQAPRDVPEVALHNGRELLGKRGSMPAVTQLEAEEVRELRHGYLAGISYLDAQIGKVLGELERLGMDQNTIVVFWSDHGFHLGEHSLWCKTSNFELDARVPLIISTTDRSTPLHGFPVSQRAGGSRSKQRTVSESPPRQEPGRSVSAVVELLDVFPTLVDLCELPQVPRLEGESLVPLLSNGSASQWQKRAAYTQHPRPAYYKGQPETMGVSVRTADVRYTEWRDFATGKVLARELYDHHSDPNETVNTVASPPNPAHFDDARRLLNRTFPVQID